MFICYLYIVHIKRTLYLFGLFFFFFSFLFFWWSLKMMLRNLSPRPWEWTNIDIEQFDILAIYAAVAREFLFWHLSFLVSFRCLLRIKILDKSPWYFNALKECHFTWKGMYHFHRSKNDLKFSRRGKLQVALQSRVRKEIDVFLYCAFDVTGLVMLGIWCGWLLLIKSIIIWNWCFFEKDAPTFKDLFQGCDRVVRFSISADGFIWLIGLLWFQILMRGYWNSSKRRKNVSASVEKGRKKRR